jgi:ATP-binding cassette subfamily F protein 3
MAKKQQSYEEMFMQVNPLQLGGASKGKSKDIHLTNIDVSFGSNRILWVEAGCLSIFRCGANTIHLILNRSGADLTMAHGRRYGLVVGKLKQGVLGLLNLEVH